MNNNPKRIIVVGIGGIGGWLVPPLCRYLHYCHQGEGKTEVVFIDGDAVEEKNFQRQNFDELGSKAELMKEKVSGFTNLRITVINEYITDQNIRRYIREDDWVLLGVDNNASRKVFSERFEEIANGVLICGGNDYDDGTVQLYARANGKDLTAPLTQDFPKIANPEDKNPGEASCEELAVAGSPQLIFTNMRAASLMCEVFYNLLIGNPCPFDVIYFSTKGLAQRAVQTKQLGGN